MDGRIHCSCAIPFSPGTRSENDRLAHVPGYASWSKFGWRRLDLGHGRKGRCKGPFFFDCAAFEFPHAGMERCLFPPV